MTPQELRQIRIDLQWSVSRCAATFDRSCRQWYNYETGIHPIPDHITHFMAAKRSDLHSVAFANKYTLLKFRDLHGLSYRQAAKIVGTTHTTWKRWEDGLSPVPADILETLQDFESLGY